MTPISLDLIPDRRPLWIWGVVLTLSAAILSAGLSSTWQTYRQIKKIEEKIVEEGRKLELLTSEKKPIADPRHKHALQVAKLLQKDLNPVFTTVERISLSSARLNSLSLDVVGGTARVDYTLESMAAGTEISDQLNAGYEFRPWRLQSMSLNATAIGGVRSYRGIWSVQLSALE